jgi:hypothetical protein
MNFAVTVAALAVNLTRTLPALISTAKVPRDELVIILPYSVAYGVTPSWATTIFVV